MEYGPHLFYAAILCLPPTHCLNHTKPFFFPTLWLDIHSSSPRTDPSAVYRLLQWWWSDCCDCNSCCFSCRGQNSAKEAQPTKIMYFAQLKSKIRRLQSHLQFPASQPYLVSLKKKGEAKKRSSCFCERKCKKFSKNDINELKCAKAKA